MSIPSPPAAPAAPDPPVAGDVIRLRGVRVHNLRDVDVDVPLGKLTLVTGVSGAGKSSLAWDALLVEAQRRYIESFSLAARERFDRLDRPDADEIAPVPPALGFRRREPLASRRVTLADLAGIGTPLREWFSACGAVWCPTCELPVVRATPALFAEAWERSAAGRGQILFPLAPELTQRPDWARAVRRDGYARAIVGSATAALADDAPAVGPDDAVWVVVDRLTPSVAPARILEAAGQALSAGGGWNRLLVSGESTAARGAEFETQLVDGLPWRARDFTTELRCVRCRTEYVDPQPRLFSTGSSLGQCPLCRGRGSTGAMRAEVQCAACGGSGLQPAARGVRIDGRNFCDWLAGTVAELLSALPRGTAGDEVWREPLARRLALAAELRLDAVPLDRRAADLSTGEIQRARLAGVLGTPLDDLLFVLDEPTAGLGPDDVRRVRALAARLCPRNTLVVVDHDPSWRETADHEVELGPGAGSAGGRIVRAGPPAAPAEVVGPRTPRAPTGWLTWRGIHAPGLSRDEFALPLGVLGLVTGPSGCGKTRLLRDVVLPAVQGSLSLPAAERAATWDEFSGGGVDEVLWLDQEPARLGARSLVATAVGAFGELRRMFAETPEARRRGWSAADFSLQRPQGKRCRTCAGTGRVTVDLQFLPDVDVPCGACRGTRYEPEILAARQRGLNIAEVLDLPVQEALAFARGAPQLQRVLAEVKGAGLGALPLGQPLATLSGGELQRLKLAAGLAGRTGRRTLFLIDQPTSGLHPRDVAQLVEVLDALLAGGCSILVADATDALRPYADWVQELSG